MESVETRQSEQSALIQKEPENTPVRLPLLALRDVVLFPYMVLPVAVGREKSVKALEAAANGRRRLFLAAQKSAQVEDPRGDELYSVGCVGEIVQVFKLPDGSVKTFVQGLWRARAHEFVNHDDGFVEVLVEPVESIPDGSPHELEAMVRQLRQAFHQYAQLNGRIPADTVTLVTGLDDAERLADVVAASVVLKLQEKQELLEMTATQERLERLLMVVLREIEILNLEKKIQARVRSQIEKSQKEYVLNEQMKAIQKELKQRDDHGKEIDELRAKIKKSGMNEEAQTAAVKELERLEKMMPHSPEATVVRTYLDWMLALPWDVFTKDHLDLRQAQKILEEDHYGLNKPKERILEYLAVSALKEKLRGPILCLVGPPGVGKTSLARSIARSLGRNFARLTLGGVHDEAEIRGHRRTYIGALPGRFIQQLRRVKSKNPVMLLDELDKMGADWRGDPAAALLEVLDPEQNHNFMDHYLDVGFDLSHIFFIATANTTHTIPPTLKDRLEIIEVSGYTPLEKSQIARRYLIPKQLKEHGLDVYAQIEMGDEALSFLIRSYTQESGVRQMERQVASIARKVAKEVMLKKLSPEAAPPAKKKKKVVLKNSRDIERYLGVPKFKREKAPVHDVGMVTGLAWTQTGGEILSIEVVRVPGEGKLQLTGQLGSTMQESAHAAFSYVKSLAAILPFETGLLKNNDFHLHVPEGAIPKDGPSAGIAMGAALASLLSKRKPKPGLAMTGEITLKGRILVVGGIREKLIAAHREGLHTVLIPEGNRHDLEDLPQEVKDAVKIIPVHHMTEVLEIVLS